VIGSFPEAVMYGAALGAASGWFSRLALKRALAASVTVFYAVFIGGIFCRLALLVAAICLLRHEKYIIIAAFALSLIIVQMLFEVFPLKRNGTERNT
jgi:hypothetical protein